MSEQRMRAVEDKYDALKAVNYALEARMLDLYIAKDTPGIVRPVIRLATFQFVFLGLWCACLESGAFLLSSFLKPHNPLSTLQRTRYGCPTTNRASAILRSGVGRGPRRPRPCSRRSPGPSRGLRDVYAKIKANSDSSTFATFCDAGQCLMLSEYRHVNTNLV